MDNPDGTTSIPSLTPAAEHLSTLKTLKEVKEKWTENSGTTVTFPTLTTGPLFGLGKRAAARPRATLTKKRTPVM